MASDTFSSSSPSPKSSWKHDVFLSFRGEDTRNGFTGHLYTALVNAGVRTFIDDEELPKGEELWSKIVKAIGESRISIVVFSKNFASSSWCLNELVEILKYMGSMNQLVRPLFYDVDPSVVRHQTESYGMAMERHQKRLVAETEKVKRWREALTVAANLSGWDLRNVASGYEPKFIQEIVNEILCVVNHVPLSVTKHLVGIDTCVKEIKSLLTVEPNVVRMIGIYGMGGIGKTTIAKAVYNLNFQNYEGSCFLPNVREAWEKHNGDLSCLQEQLLLEILRRKSLKVHNFDRGIMLIKERLCCKRVLVVLDDVDQLSQLNSLAGAHNWFGPGSRIIITTREVGLLSKAKVDDRYEVKTLTHDQSLQLFSCHAFEETEPTNDYLELTNNIVCYTNGLPLALEVLGSYFKGGSIPEWRSAFEKLKQIPYNQIQKQLRISFDGLNDDKVKEIFLDIACFFVGMHKDYIMNILDACGLFPEIGLSILISRCLLKITSWNKVWMHDLVRDMGREIVREESLKDAGKRSRLWFHEDVRHVLGNNKGTKKVEGLDISISISKEMNLDGKAFESMPNLRLLQANHLHLNPRSIFKLRWNYNHICKELRWLCWNYCPMKSLPSEFHVQNIAILDLKFSSFKRVWQDKKFMKNLKILDLSHCERLTDTPNFAGAPKLEKLLLPGCTSLFKIHPSIVFLESLIHLNLEDCKSLRDISGAICGLKSLKFLNLTGCSNLQTLPENLGDVEALTEILANGTKIKKLPFSIALLKNLTTVSLQGCNKKLSPGFFLPFISSWMLLRRNTGTSRFLPPSIAGLQSLTYLKLRGCNLHDGDIPDDLGSLSSLIEMDFSENKFYSLPSSIKEMWNLDRLDLDGCKNLLSLTQLPPNLSYCGLVGNTSLEKLVFEFNPLNYHRILALDDCTSLSEIQGLNTIKSFTDITMEGCNKVSGTLTDTFFLDHSEYMRFDVCFPKGEIPDWFEYQTTGSSIRFQTPLALDLKFIGMTLWVVYATNKEHSEYSAHSNMVTIRDITNGVEGRLLPWLDTRIAGEEQSWVSYVPRSFFRFPLEGGEKIVEVHEISELEGEVIKCGVHLEYKRNDDYNDNAVVADHVKDIFLGLPLEWRPITTEGYWDWTDLEDLDWTDSEDMDVWDRADDDSEGDGG